MRLLGLFLLCKFLNLALMAQGVQLKSYYQVVSEPYSRPLPPISPALSIPNGISLTIAERGFSWTQASASHPWDRERRFHSRRYLPCDEVSGFALLPPNSFLAATACGNFRFTIRPQRLADKAAHYERIRAARHDRHGLTAPSVLGSPGDLASSRTASNDNDGLWTAMYATAKLYEFAATGSKAALAQAEKSLNAVLRLTELTEIPGYPARSFIMPAEIRPKDGVWYPLRGGGEWKSDTSSDEIVGHFLVFATAWDLLPKSELRNRVRSTAKAMMDHILANGYHLIDRTGKPTTLGRWSPEYFASAKGRPDSPLNSIELMSFLRVAWHITGDPRYERELRKAAFDLDYLKIATEVRERQQEINYSDEELALLSFYPLLKYEKRHEYREPILRALNGWWRNISREANPLWNTIYELATKPDPALRAASIKTLERLPLDLVTWRIENSWRKDLPRDAARDRFNLLQTTTLLAPDERPVMKWNGNPFVLDGGNGGASEDDGAIFLLPYWMGRYYKLWGER
jgi:hypothetical protein